jgi:hypothetical protein
VPDPPERLLVFNPRFEAELESRALAPAPRSDRARERLERRLAARFLFRGGPGDRLVADFQLPEDFVRRLAAQGVGLPSVGPAVPARVLPWGFSASVAELARGVGAPLEAPPPEAVRRVNSKAFAHELATRLGLPAPGSVRESTATLEAALRERFAPGELWVVKRAFGFGGLGHLFGRGLELPPNGRGWLAKAFSHGEPVVLEPWVARERDLSVQLDVSPGGDVALLGALELVATPNGGYLGNRIGVLPPDLVRALETTATSVGRELAREGYFGPAGIDAYVSRGELRPLVEVNGRHTLGRIALELARTLVPAGACGAWLTIPGPRAKGPPLEGEGWVVTDPFPEEPGPITVFVVGEDAAVLARREAMALGALSSPAAE